MEEKKFEYDLRTANAVIRRISEFQYRSIEYNSENRYELDGFVIISLKQLEAIKEEFKVHNVKTDEDGNIYVLCPIDED